MEKGEYTRSNGTSDTNITYGTNAGQYNENYEYDIMGNFELINRYHGNASSAIDQLAFFYTGTGNRVSQISDASGNSTGFSGTSTYGYDAAGRMTSDSQKGTIAYNHLGLVKTVTKNSDVLTYTYDATGRRLKKQLGTEPARYYMDGVEYEGANLQFVATPYGRIRKNGSNWEFDYFLKDHLGNVRVVLEAGSASPSSSVSPISSNTATYLATMEISKAEEEELYFANLNTTRADRPYNYPDKNPLNTKLAKVPGKSRGPSIMLRVMAGDTIEISAKAFYNIDDSQQGKGIDFSSIAGAAIAALTNPVSTVIGEMQRITNDLGAVANQSTVLHPLLEENLQNNMPQPKSGINFVAYNDKFEVVEINTGMILVEDRINEIQTLAADRMVITESGFLEIFANNDAQTPVYYDNMMITMTTGPVMEVNAYYPFGMIITDLSLAALPDKKNFYKYGAKELQTELGLNWGDHHARMYDATVGRWWVTDPLAEKFYNISPYVYVGNNPIRRIDPNGMDWWDTVNGSIRGVTDNVFGTNSRAYYNPTDAADYNSALTKADIVCVAAGAVMTVGGADIAGTGLAAAPVTGGTSLVASAAGVAISAEGAFMTTNATRHLATGNNYGNGAKGKYDDVPNPKNVGDGKSTTSTQRKNILEENKRQNNGVMKSDGDGRNLNPPSKNVKGKKVDMNQAEVDHMKPKSKGGSNDNSNLQVLSKEENLKKGNR